MKGNREPFRFLWLVTGLISAVAFNQLAHSQSAVNVPLAVFSTTPWYFQGDVNGAEFGFAVASAGDVNGDGYADVIVGAPKYTDTTYKGGAVFVFYGTPGGLPDYPDWTMSGDLKGARFGSAVASAGDINGDGYDDIIIGAPLYKVGDQPETGRVYVVYGSENGLPNPITCWSIDGEQANDQFGYAVGSAGDVNNDTFADIIIGARQYADATEAKVGAAYLFFGSEQSLTQNEADWKIVGNQAGSRFGGAVSTAGDVNGDLFDDIIIGAPNYDNGQDNEGAVYVYLGYGTGTAAHTTYDWKAESNSIGAWFGHSVSTAGNVNGDAFADVIVGAPYYDGLDPDEGGAFVYYGSDSGLVSTPQWTAVSGQTGSGFGTAVSSAGDVNNDGFGDVIVGANQWTSDQSHEGGAIVYLGGSGGLGSTGWMASGDKADTGFGFSVGGAGDINGDGSGEIIIGAPQYRHDTDIKGRAFVYFGLRTDWPFNAFLPLVINGSP